MIETTNSNIVYIADGIQTEFEYPYPFVEDDDINLYITLAGVRTKISKDSFSFDTSTKKVTYPLSGDPVISGSYVEIARETALTQLEDSSIVAFKSNDVEWIADKLTMICQDTQRMVADAIAPEGGQIQEAVAEALSVHDNSASAHPLKEDKANKVTSISDSSTDTQYPSAKVVNTELNKKQPKTLSESITINGAVITTVEGALNAINGNTSIANISLSNLNSAGESHFANPSLSNVTGTSGFRRLVEVYHSGTSWYKVFAEYNPTTGAFIGNWCEQGGRFESADESETQVDFLKEFADTNYALVGMHYGNQGLAQYANGWNVITLNTAYAVIKNQTNGTNSFMWTAYGYLAEEE